MYWMKKKMNLSWFLCESIQQIDLGFSSIFLKLTRYSWKDCKLDAYVLAYMYTNVLGNT